MPKSLPIFSSFSSGEITPRLASRSDVDAYKNGVNIMRNMIATSHGPAARRYGMEMINWDDPADGTPRLLDARIFGFSITKSFGTFVFVALREDGTTGIAPYDPNGKIIDPAQEMLTNGGFENGGTGWTDVSSGTGQMQFLNGKAIFLAGSVGSPVAYNDSWVSTTIAVQSGDVNPFGVTTVDIHKEAEDGTDRGADLLLLKSGDTMRIQETAQAQRWIEFQVTGDPTDNGTSLTIPVTETGAGTEIRDNQNCIVQWTVIPVTDNSAGIEQEVTGAVNGNTMRLRVFGDPNSNSVVMNYSVGSSQGATDLATGTFTGRDLDITFTNTGGTSVWLVLWTETDAQSRSIDQVSMVDETVNVPGASTDVSFTGPWTSKDLPFLQADSPPEGDVLYITSPYTAPHKLSYDTATQGWTFEIVTFTGKPDEWTGENWPRAITFYQGRMWLGGTPNERETFWASKSAAIENFTQGANADDGLEFTLSEQGEIEWVTGAKNLIIGTANGEHIVESSSGVIIPSDIQISQQSAYGSRAIQSEKIGQKVMYVSPDGRKMREIGYQWTDDGWLSRDITFASEHITMDNNIKQMAFAQNPDNLLWCVTDQGDAVCCTYEKTYDVIGWHRHDTEGKFLDVATFDLNGTSLAGFIVQRSVNGVDRLFLEIIDPYESFRSDSWVYQYYETPTVEVTGLTHLAGNTVDVLTDSGVHPSVPVDSTGKLYLQWEANEVVCGHNYVSHLRTLSPDMIGNEGSTHAMEKSWNRVVVRVYDSPKPLINDVRPPERYPATPMDTFEPGKTEDCQAADLGWQSWDWVDVKQDLPGKLTILGIFGEQQREHL